MKQPIDAIILAGDRTASRDILGKNKMVLEVGGIPLLLHVLQALEDVERVSRVIIIGPRSKAEELIRNHSSALKNNKPVMVLEQKENMLGNFWSAFIHSIPGYYAGMEEDDSEVREKVVLVLPSDLPFITSREIEEFLDASPMDRLDYSLGMTEERYLEKFYPRGSQPGIRMAYLYLREGNYRLNNLHLIRPFRVENRNYIEKIYERRYQKNIINIVKMLYDFLVSRGLGWRAIHLYTMLEMSLFFRHIGCRSMEAWFKRKVSQEEVRSFAAKLLATRIDIVETTMGGTALDIDNDRDYQTIKLRLQEWRELLEIR